MDVQANIDLVTAFCHSWNTPDDAAALLAPDASVRMYFDKPPIIGAGNVAAEMRRFLGSAAKLQVHITKIFAEGPVVVTLRRDVLARPDTPEVEYRTVGVFHLKNGKIVEWIDYNAAEPEIACA